MIEKLNNLWKYLKRLLGFGKAELSSRHKLWPTKEEIALLPEFEGLGPEQIVQISSPEGAEKAYLELVDQGVVGFDTESKPTFLKGEESTGPHLAQFSTMDQAYIFQLQDENVQKVVGRLIAEKKLKKVGFGLNDDIRRARSKLKVEPHSVVDIETLFNARGFGRGVGVKVGIALVFKKKFRKSKKASTSNWMNHNLTPAQLLYAANDAYAAMCVYKKLMENEPRP